jgi:hypothetical protein
MESNPFLWPAIRGSSLFFAQRPLPSIITARCLGVFNGFKNLFLKK